MFSLGIGWVLALVCLILKDVQHGISLVIMSLFFLSPFAYTPEMVPQGLKFILLQSDVIFCHDISANYLLRIMARPHQFCSLHVARFALLFIWISFFPKI